MSKFLDVMSDVITAVAKAYEEDRSREAAMAMVSRNTMFLDQYAKGLVKDLAGFNLTSYYARRQIEALCLSDDEKTYLKRRIITEAQGLSVDYYARSQIDHLLRTI